MHKTIQTPFPFPLPFPHPPFPPNTHLATRPGKLELVTSLGHLLIGHRRLVAHRLRVQRLQRQHDAQSADRALDGHVLQALVLVLLLRLVHVRHLRVLERRDLVQALHTALQELRHLHHLCVEKNECAGEWVGRKMSPTIPLKRTSVRALEPYASMRGVSV